MNGRDVIESRYNRSIENNLCGMPSYCRMYYRTLSDKTNGTKNNYISKLKIFLDFISGNTLININKPEELSNIKPSMINDFLNNHIKGSATCKANYYYAIKSLFEYLYIDEYIDKNPCERIKAPVDKKEHKITYLTDEEIQIVLNNIECGVGEAKAKSFQRKWRKRNRALIMLAISTGLRSSSIRAINIEDVDLVECSIRIFEKGNKERILRISQQMSNVLRSWIVDRQDKIDENDFDDDDALFISKHGKRLSQSGFTELLKTFTSNIDKNITPHKLRSTYATHAIKKTHDIYLVANQLGHSNIRNTARYAAVDDEMKKKAAAAMDDILF